MDEGGATSCGAGVTPVDATTGADLLWDPDRIDDDLLALMFIAVAPSVAQTEWERIVLLYEALRRLAPSPVVELNRAVAISVAQGPATALPVVDDLVAAGSLPGSHLLPSVRGELLSRLGRTDEARRELELA